MEQQNDTGVSENFTTELTGFHIDYSIVKLSSLVPEWSIVTLIIYIITAMVIGLSGNSLVLIVLRKVKQKTSTDWFVIFIAACDLISLSVSGTLYILFLVPDIWTAISSEFVCKFHYYVIHCVFLESLLLITLMGIDRYIKTCRPHSVLFTPKITVKCCLIITAVLCLFNIPLFFTTKLNIYGECGLDSTTAAFHMSVHGVYLVAVLLCSIVVIIMYWKIAVRIRRRIKVEPSVVMSTLANCTPNRHRTQTMFLSGSQEKKSNTLTQQHATNTSASCIANKHRNISTVLSRSQEKNSNTVRKQHVSLKCPEMEEVNISNSTCTVNSKHNTNEGSEQEEHTMRKKKVTNKLINQRFELNIKPSTSFAQQVIEDQRGRRTKEIYKHESQRSKQVDKTTKIMGAITLVFIISTAFPVIAISIFSALEDIKRDPIARVIVFFVTRLYLINNFANPLFYIWLSSEFKKRAFGTLNGCKS